MALGSLEDGLLPPCEPLMRDAAACGWFCRSKERGQSGAVGGQRKSCGERVDLVRCGRAASLRGPALPLAQHVHELNAR